MLVEFIEEALRAFVHAQFVEDPVDLGEQRAAQLPVRGVLAGGGQQQDREPVAVGPGDGELPVRRASASSALALTCAVISWAKLSTAMAVWRSTCRSAAAVAGSKRGPSGRAFARSVRVRQATRSTTAQISSVSRPVRSTSRKSSPSLTRGLSRRLSSACRRAASTWAMSLSRRRASCSLAAACSTLVGPEGSSPRWSRSHFMRPARSVIAAPHGSDPQGWRQQQVDQQPDHRADDRLQHPVPGGVRDLGDAEDEHGADRDFGDELVDAHQVAHDQRGQDQQAEAPPGQTHQRAEADRDQYADDDGVHPADAGGQRGVQRDLDDEQGRQGAVNGSGSLLRRRATT